MIKNLLVLNRTQPPLHIFAPGCSWVRGVAMTVSPSHPPPHIADLARSGFFGMWRDATIKDGAAVARRLRSEELSRRS
jgi:hypothetical protein